MIGSTKTVGMLGLMHADTELPAWSGERYERAAERSSVIHGNRLVFPVAGWLLEADSKNVEAKEVVVGLGGRIATKQVHEAFGRLIEIGAVEELPYPGRPHPRVWRRVDSPYWGYLGLELTALEQPDSTFDE